MSAPWFGPGVNSKLAAVVKSDTVLVDFKMTALDYLRAERRNIKFGEQGYDPFLAADCNRDAGR